MFSPCNFDIYRNDLPYIIRLSLYNMVLGMTSLWIGKISAISDLYFPVKTDLFSLDCAFLRFLLFVSLTVITNILLVFLLPCCQITRDN